MGQPHRASSAQTEQPQVERCLSFSSVAFMEGDNQADRPRDRPCRRGAGRKAGSVRGSSETVPSSPRPPAFAVLRPARQPEPPLSKAPKRPEWHPPRAERTPPSSGHVLLFIFHKPRSSAAAPHLVR